MPNPDIARRRLASQRLTGTPFEQSAAVVGWLGAVQAQDYTGAKWALGLRTRGIVDADVDQAFNAGAILRTHVLRPTWHFVLPVDIRWLLMLTAPRVHALNAAYYRKTELDDTLLKRSHSIIAKALEGGRHLTRAELAAELERAGIAASGLRLTYLVMHAELEGIICSGARRGKQFTYALLDERAPQTRTLTRDEALAELTLRFFTSRGPATPHDFSKWSGLTLADARTGLDAVKHVLAHEEIEGKAYWFADAPAPDESPPRAYWLPNYDEYISSYADYSAMVGVQPPQMGEQIYYNYPHVMVMDGQIVGYWKRILRKNAVLIETYPLAALPAPAVDAFNAAAERYGGFVQMPVAQSPAA